MLIPKANELRNNFPCWVPVTDSYGFPMNPVIYCKCGRPCGINNHTITNGFVYPSFWHQKKELRDLAVGEVNGCDFHEHLQLDDFK